MSTNGNGITTECKQCEPNECSYNLRERRSLTGELERGGCAHYYLGKILPNLAGFVRSLKLPTGTVLKAAPKGWESFIGTAFDHYLRGVYAPTEHDKVAREGLRRMLLRWGQESAIELLESKDPCENEYWAQRLEDESSPATRVLAGMKCEIPEERAIWSAVAVTEFRRGWGEVTCSSLESGGSQLMQELVEDIRGLMEITQDNLVLHKPEFGLNFGLSSAWLGRGADADIVDEGCLIDIKCYTKPEPTAFLRQVIAYALLDVDDEHRLDSVGIYLARQGIFWKVPLNDIAKQAGASLQELRDNAPWGNPADRDALKSAISEYSEC